MSEPCGFRWREVPEHLGDVPDYITRTCVLPKNHIGVAHEWEVKMYCHICGGSWTDPSKHPEAHNAEGHLEECFTNPVTREPYDLPEGLKDALVHLFTNYPDMPRGLCDPMYFANVIARNMGFGDGASNFHHNLRREYKLDDEGHELAIIQLTEEGVIADTFINGVESGTWAATAQEIVELML